MNIDASPIGLTPDSPVLVAGPLRIVITLELVTMTGAPHTLAYTDSFDRECNQPKPATLAEMVAFVFRRNHPRFEYIAEQNGVKVVEYKEMKTFRQAMSQFEYQREPDGSITLLV